MSRRQLPIILALGTTQTLAWASSYYLPAILADPIARDLGVSSNWIFARLFGLAADLGRARPARRPPDRSRRRQAVLSISNLTLAAGLVLLGFAYSIPVLVAAWILLGIGMARASMMRPLPRSGASMATGAPGHHRHHPDRRLCQHGRLAADRLGLGTIGWRDTCFAWAAAHILIGLPLNLLMLPPVTGAKAAVETAVKPHIPIDRTMVAAGVRLCRGLDRHRCDGGASAADPGGRRRDLRAGGGGRRTDRPGTGAGPHCRGELFQPLPSTGLDPARLPDAPDRRRHPRRSPAAARQACSRSFTAPATAS